MLLDEARARDLGRDRRGELRARRSSSSRARPQRDRPRRGAAGSAWAARGSRSSADEDATRFSLAGRCPSLRGALLADADGVILEVDRSPEAVAFALVGARARGEPDRRAVPRPPDQHQAQAARRRRSTRRRDGADELARRAPRAASPSSRHWYRDYYERNLDDETGQFPIDPAGPRVVLVPGRRHRHERRATRAGRAFARDLYHRADRGRGRGRRARRLPLAERGRGVRDRVLAARALQARPGAAARRARRQDRARHRRRERHRPRDRARCSPSAAPTSSSPT